MRFQTTFNLFLSTLFVVKVQGAGEIDACSRKEPSPGVLTLTLGREVVLGCRGDVTVDGVPLAVVTKHKGTIGKRKARAPLNTDSFGTTGTHNSEMKNVTIRGTYQNVTTTRIYRTDKRETKTTASPLITMEKRTWTGNIQSNSVGRVNKGGAFRVTMEMGDEYEDNMSVEYEQYEDYGDKEGEPRVTRAISRRAQWTRNGQSLRWGVEKGGALRLPGLQLKDSGNYTCFRGGQLISSVQISVGVPPEKPTLKCYKKFHTSKIRCEWVAKQPIIPRPRCYIVLRKGMKDSVCAVVMYDAARLYYSMHRWAESSHMACSYSPERSRCWCALPGEEGDRNVYVARLCVANAVGSAASDPLRYIPTNIIRPDPPANVVAEEVTGQLQTLHISWSYPASWRQGFYFLQFQLRYRPLQAREYQQVDIDGTDLFWLILDAIPDTQYEIQLRAKDEYDGLWSDWTAPVYAHTWSAVQPTVHSNFYTSMEPLWTFTEGSRGSEDSGVELTVSDCDLATDRAAAVWVYVLFGLCVFIIFIILSVYSIRHKVQLMSRQENQGSSPFCSLSTAPPPLLQPLEMGLHQQSQHHILPVQEEAGIHLHNVDYFLSHGD